VCRKAGVSTATVSRVINGSPLVTGDTRDRVLKAIRSLGYRPSHAARTLARNRTDILGVVFPEIASGFFTEVLRGIDDVADEHGYHLMTCFSHGLRDEKEFVGRMLRERRMDGLILMNLSTADSAIREMTKHDVPIVLIDRPLEESKLCAITMDNLAGAEAATRHLVEHGHDRIAILTGPEDSYDSRQRFEGFRCALERSNKTIFPDLIWKGAFTEESGIEAMRAWLESRKPLPDAIFASNDAMALGVWSVLRERGVRVPDDVALVGFDDVESARHQELTSVSVPMRAMGRAAAEAAIQQISSHKTQPRRMLPTALVVRRSCGCKGIEKQP
jgi:LacI family transcriptional regulator